MDAFARALDRHKAGDFAGAEAGYRAALAARPDHDDAWGNLGLILARRDGRWIAGALNLIGSDTLYGRYWGATEHVPFLHFELCYYQAIEHAIARGLKRVEAGAQGQHKIARGYLPSPVYSAHFIADPALRGPVADYLEQERVAVSEDMAALTDELSPFRHEG